MTDAAAADTQVPYSIPAGGFLRLVTDGSPSTAGIGWAQLTPDGGTTTPVSAAVYGFTQGGILVTEAGVPAVATTAHARIYVDKSGAHDTGLAVANPGNASMRITATAYQPDGTTRAGSGPATLDLAPLGHDARFAGQHIGDRIRGCPDLPRRLRQPAPRPRLYRVCARDRGHEGSGPGPGVRCGRWTETIASAPCDCSLPDSWASGELRFELMSSFR